VINGDNANPIMKKLAYSFILNMYLNDPEMRQAGAEICSKAIAELPNDADIKFFHAAAMNGIGRYQAALDLLVECLDSIEAIADYGGLSYISADPAMVYNQLLFSAQSLGDIVKLIEYATFALSGDKSMQSILGPFIASLLGAGRSDEDIINLLSRIYDVEDAGDLMFIARAAKDAGAIDFARFILEIVKEYIG
jgi:tetratricopeptide (TPR) repeat protein